MFKNILVPFDNSDSAKNALKTAIEMVDGIDGAKVMVLKVVEWQDYNAETFKIASRMSGVLGDSLDMNSISEIGEDAEREETSRVKAEVDEIIAGCEFVDISVVNGSPHETIVKFASDLDYDCIVMGHRGMGIIRGMLGSVAFSVLQKTNRPVLVVK